MKGFDLAFVEGNVLTVDDDFSKAEALGVKNGRIAAVGSKEEVMGGCSGATRVINLKGKTVIPGIVDSHNHLVSAGTMMREGVLLFDCESIDELKEKVAAHARRLPEEQWIMGAGWIENQFEEWRSPTRWDLDEAEAERPVVLRRLFGAVTCNSRALQLAGILEDPNMEPPRGTIERDSHGRPTGVLRDGAQSLVLKHRPRENFERKIRRKERAIKEAGEEYLKYGITTVVDPGVSPENMRAYCNMHARGELPLRVNMMPVSFGLYVTRETDEKRMEHRISDFGVYNGFGDNRLNLGALKMAIDGGLGSKTAWMQEPFSDGTYADVPLRLDIERLRDYFELGHKHGWSVGIHCCGDRAQKEAVQRFVDVLSEYDLGCRRNNIIHGYFADEPVLEMMKEHDIAVSAQPGFIWVEGDIYFQHVDEEKLEGFTPLKTYLEKGITVACNSDFMSGHYNPFWGMHSALTRRTSRGRVLGTKETLTPREMLPMFTKNGAYLAFLENEVGTLDEGKCADLAVLSDDICSVDPDQVREMSVHLTVLEGEIVYSDGTLA